MYDDVIHTDARGVPFERPERPGPDATIEELAAWLDRLHAYNDAIAAGANRAFDKAFSKALRRDW
jgi:hypothetical protein